MSFFLKTYILFGFDTKKNNIIIEICIQQKNKYPNKMQIISRKTTLLGLILTLNILSNFAQVSSISAASGAWNSIIQQANFDPSDDQQALSATDMVGNALNAMLESQKENYTFSTGTSQDDVFYFRVRLGDHHTNGKLGTSFYLALDIDNDKIADVFVEANIKDNTSFVAFHIADASQAGTGPSNTGWENSTNNTNIERVLDSRHAFITAYDATTDLDANNETDTWLEFAFTQESIQSFAADALGLTITGDTAIALYTFTSTSQTANGDIGGVNDNTDDLTATWEALGVFINGSLNNISSGVLSPTIASIAPTSAKVGDTITITGTNFSSNSSDLGVFFDNVQARIVSSTTTQIFVEVPAGTTAASTLKVIDKTKGSIIYPKTFYTSFENTDFSGVYNNSSAFSNAVNFSGTSYWSTTSAYYKDLSQLVDLDNDGMLDYVTIAHNNSTIIINRNTLSPGDVITSNIYGSTDSIQLTGSGNSTSVSVSDLNTDCKLDLIVTNGSSVDVFLNTSSGSGDISFSSAQNIASFPSYYRIRHVDLNNDGLLDILSSSGSNIHYSLNQTSLGSSTINFQQVVSIPTNETFVDFDFKDFNSDGNLDIVGTSSTGYSISFGGGMSWGTFTKTAMTLGSYGRGADLVTKDFDLDDDIDIVLKVSTTGISYLENDGSGSFTSTSASITRTTGLFHGFETSNVDGDNDSEILAANGNSSTYINIFDNTSSNSSLRFENSSDPFTSGNAMGLKVADVNSDGRPDVVTPRYYNSSGYVLQNVIGLPTISSISSTSGASGDTLTITGTYLSNTSAITVGGDPVSAFTVNSGTSILVTLGSGSTGKVVLTTPGGQATSSSTFTFSPGFTVSESMNAFDTCIGNPSDSQSFTVSGSNLTADISIAALTAYEYSLDDVTYSSTLSITPTSGAVASTTVYVRLTGASAGTPSGNIPLSSTGATSRTIAVTGSVNVLAVPQTEASVSYCQNETASVLTATALSGYVLNWYAASTGGSPLSTAPTPTTTAVGTTTYYVSQTNSTTGCESDRAAITVTVYAIPNAPAASDVNYCVDETATALTATADSGHDLLWYTDATGGTASTSAPVPSTTAVGSATYYVSQKQTAGTFNINQGITSNTYNASLTVNSFIGQTFTVSTANVLNTINIVINRVSGRTYQLKLYDSYGGTLLATSDNNVTGNSGKALITFNFNNSNPILNQGSTYYIELRELGSNPIDFYYTVGSIGSTNRDGSVQTVLDLGFSLSGTLLSNPCESARTPIVVTVGEIPAAPVASDISYCQNETPTALTATVLTGNTLQWYTIATGGTASTTAPTPSTSVSGSTTYYVSQKNDVTGCEGDRTSIAVTVEEAPYAYDRAVNFASSGYLSSAPTSTLNLSNSNSFTLEAWIYPVSFAESSAGIISKGNAFSFKTESNGVLSFIIEQSWSWERLATSANALSVNTWQHVAATYDGDTRNMNLYIDGNLVGSYTRNQSFTPNFTSGNLFIGRNISGNGGYSRQFNGNIDEVKIWNISKTSNEIAANYASELQGTESNLMAYYKFDQGVGSADNTSISSFVDSSSNGNDLTINSMSMTGTAKNILQIGPAIFGVTEICESNTSTLTHPYAGGTWSSSDSSILSVNASSGVLEGKIAGIATIQYDYTINGCSYTSSKAITVNATPAAPVASDVILCQNETALALTATPLSGHTLLWHTVATGGTASTTAPTPVTSSSGTTTYYVSHKNDTTGCEGDRTPIVVTVGEIPAAPVASDISYCINETASALTATPLSGHTLLWHTVATGGTASTTAPTPVTSSSGTVTYYVSQKNDTTGCEGDRTAITINVDEVASPLVGTTITTKQVFTDIGSTSWVAPSGVTELNYLVVGGGGGGGNGFDTGGGGGGAGGMVLTGTLNVIPGQSYSVTVGRGGIGGENIRSNRSGGAGNNSVFQTITAFGGPGGGGSRSGGTGSGGSAQVGTSNAPTGGAGGGNGSSSVRGSGGGGGGAAGNGGNGSSASGGSGGAGVNSAISGVSTFYGVGGKGAKGNASTTGLVATSNTGNGGGAGGARSSSSRPGGNGGSGVVILSYSYSEGDSFEYCEGATAQALEATPSVGNTLNWYTVASGGTASTTAPVPDTATAGVTTYYVSQITANGCESLRVPIQVTVNPLPVVSGNTSVAAGESITLSATTDPASTNAWVSSSPTNASVDANGVVRGLALGNMVITYTNANGCSIDYPLTVTAGTTQTPVLTAPATNTTGATTLQVTYTLPEAPLSGSVSLTFTPTDGSLATVWTMTDETSVNFSYDVGTNPTTILVLRLEMH